MSHKIKTFVCAVFMLLVGWTNVQAQLPDNVRDVFESMTEELDPDLAKLFKKAISRDTATVEFTPEQFRRFRDDPINPFEGLDQIRAADGSGNIALKFELPSLRNRPVHHFERQHDNLKRDLNTAVGSASASTVRIFNDKKQVALGSAIDRKGLLLTKASEVENETKIVCHLMDGRKLKGKIVRIDKPTDIALVSVAANDLIPIKWSSNQPLLGAFVLTPDFDGNVLAVGTYSVTPRSTSAGEQAFLGVKPETTPQGVKISEVRRGEASYEAGLQNGDVIFKLGGVPIRDVTQLVMAIRNKRPGDRVAIEFLRNGAKQMVQAKLAGRNMNGERAARFKMMNRLGAVPSRRSDGFPNVFQHDSPLFPEQCGGPIVDLKGNVIGMNIARNGRAASYAVPSSHVQTIIKELARDSVASVGTGASDDSGLSRSGIQ